MDATWGIQTLNDWNYDVYSRSRFTLILESKEMAIQGMHYGPL